MATGFTPRERESITEALRSAAARHATQGSMKKISVDELCAEAGISKGAFYKFYPSKEHLFLEVLERWHQAVSEETEKAVAQDASLDGQQRAAVMMKTACRVMREQSLAKFQETEAPLLLRKIPEQDLQNHMLTEASFAHELLQKMNVKFSVPESVAFSMAYILFRSLRDADGPNFDEALDRLIDSACQAIVLP